MANLFINATLVLSDRLLPNGWLLEENGKILRYGSGEAPAADEVTDCGGNYLSPALSMSTATAAEAEASASWNWKIM